MRFGFIFICFCLLGACASEYSSSAEKAYLKANNAVNLVVPAPLSHQEISHYYDLPDPTGAAGVSILPPVSLT